MCRLYAFRSNHPRKVECELIRAQNALIVQSRHDATGSANADGWGLGAYRDDVPCVERQAEPAFASEAFRWTAAHLHACDVVAHVRHATVGGRRVENTHPFGHGQWLFAHNGTIEAFEAVRPRLLAALPERHRWAIAGETDSEHLFHYLLARHEAAPHRPLLETLGEGLRQVIAWSREADPAAAVALNVVLTDGAVLAGARYGRSLWYIERGHVHACEVCGGALHVETPPRHPYHAVVVASEPVTTTETWTPVPEGSLFFQAGDGGLQLAPLSTPDGPTA